MSFGLPSGNPYVGATYVGNAVSFPLNGIVGQEDFSSGLNADEMMMLNTLMQAESAGVGAALPALYQTAQRMAQLNPRFGLAVQQRMVPKPAPRPFVGPPAIPINFPNPINTVPSVQQPQAVMAQQLIPSGPTDLPINGPSIPAGGTVTVLVRPNFTIRGTQLILSEQTRASFFVSNPSIGGVAVNAGAGEVAGDLYPPDATRNTLYPSLDTSQTLELTFRNATGGALIPNGILAGQAARPGITTN